ncbi:cortex morphogenetic protein CmpA [Paenibacillus pasadenensis]|nr:cortex morphogenetic protein CmpA [Paenibacillus pasadenensis]MCM3748294.1 cortex morphogenetic protein CmpA [Paenibacillus pasadenensis]
MPQWLSNQLKRAFQQKDLRQVRLLNDCWFYYRNKQQANQETQSAGQEI